MQKNQAHPDTSNIRLAELIAALSLATDLGMGQPMEYAQSVCILSVRLGEALGIDESQLREVYYLALLRHIGCNAETYRMADLFGDELALRTSVASVDSARSSQMIGIVIRSIQQANEGKSALQLARTIAQGLMNGPNLMKEEYTGFCEVAQRLAGRLGFDEEMKRALGQVFERWDGRGSPGKLKGEAIARSMRIVTLVQDVITFHRLEGVDAAVAMIRERKGKLYDPHMVDCFCQQASRLLMGLDDENSWEAVLGLEPGVRTRLLDEQFDTACLAIADFADIKSPYTLGHSVGVAELAAQAARHCGLPESDSVDLKRAALLHDVGRVAISAGIWGKPGPLSEREWERVRMHPYYTERVLARPDMLARLGALAALHHERLDGSGYYRRLPASMLSPAARILAAADVYHAMTEPRPHRPALEPAIAAEQLLREARAGRIDSEAANGVLAAAGHKVRTSRRELVAGLSQREIEVLRLVARGHTIKQIANILTLSEKTVYRTIQSIPETVRFTPDGFLDFRLTVGNQTQLACILLEMDMDTHQKPRFQKKIASYVAFVNEGLYEQTVQTTSVVIGFVTPTGVKRAMQMKLWCEEQLVSTPVYHSSQQPTNYLDDASLFLFGSIPPGGVCPTFFAPRCGLRRLIISRNHCW